MLQFFVCDLILDMTALCGTLSVCVCVIVLRIIVLFQRKHDEREAKYQKLRDNMSKVMVRGQTGKFAYL